MGATSREWILEEFKTIELGDKRIEDRFFVTAATLADHPEESINRASETWSQSKAAYRLFGHSKVSAEALLEPHIQRTIERCQSYKTVLAIQDTSFLIYNSRPKTEGLGPISRTKPDAEKAVRGLIMHNVFAVSTEGLPLGILDQTIWAREKLIGQSRRMSYAHQIKPIEQKESHKWVESLKRAESLKPEGVEFVLVADREADIYELFRECESLQAPFVIRASQNRAINKQSRREPPKEKLWPWMKEQKIVGKFWMEVPDSKTGKRRKARMEFSFSPVTVTPPPNRTEAKHGNDLINLQLTAIYVRERKPPPEREPLEWMLWTNLPVETKTDVLEKIDWYRQRWNIESFHKILKSGYAVESCQLRHGDRLIKFVTLMSILAWRIFWLSRINRIDPQAPCTEILTAHEWKALYLKLHRGKPLPKAAPKIHEAVLWIAKLGGFLGRKSDGVPGYQAVWRGWHRLADLAEHYLLFSKSGARCG